MITGIITAILFVIVCLQVFNKQILKTHGVFTSMQIPANIALVIAVIAHVILTFPIYRSRPISVVISGLAAVFFVVLCCCSTIKNTMRLRSVSAACAVIAVVLHLVFNLTSVAAYQNLVKNTVVTDVDLSEIPDGIYIGEYHVTFIYAKTEVTVAANKITNIRILEHRNERGAAAERIINRIIDQQSIEVDAIAGATNSSTVIKKAVENALLTGYPQ